ncbi:MAG: hypothetical protein K2X81_07485, partial [Candidatus Obscuribacterales bacterium]|nr:hypothetical protein [Candidatus Obscuribacterales bacterium]
ARQVFLHSLVGGYGTGSLNSFKNFLDIKILQRIIFPANRDLLSRVGMEGWNLEKNLNFILSAAYAAILGCGAARILLRSANLRILAFLLFWILVALLPTYQIWFISPNLVGSRLFFLSSAPMTLLLAFLALPAIDALNSKAVKAISCVGSLALIVVVSIWSYWLNFDMQAWTGAARSLQNFSEQLLNKIENSDASSKCLMLNLPSDYSGAGIVACQNYLKIMMKPPLTKSDYSSRVFAFEPPPLSQNYDYSEGLQSQLENDPKLKVFTWTPATGLSEPGKITEWHPAQTDNPTWNFDAKNERSRYIEISKDNESNYLSATISNAKEITKEGSAELKEHPNDSAFVLSTASGIRIKPTQSGVILLFQKDKISPLKQRVAEIKAKVLTGKAPPIALLWLPSGESENNSRAQINSQNSSSKFHEIRFDANAENIEIQLGRYLDWALTPELSTIALYAPKGDYTLELDKITIH